MSIETMKMALEALEIVNREMLALRDELAERGGRPTQGYHQLLWDSSHKVYTDTAIPAAESLRQAIEQAQKQEPYGYLKLNTGRFVNEVEGLNPMTDKRYLPLYTFPPQRQPLTEEEIKKAAPTYAVDDFLDFNAGVRFAEAAHGIKGDT